MTTRSLKVAYDALLSACWKLRGNDASDLAEELLESAETRFPAVPPYRVDLTIRGRVGTGPKAELFRIEVGK